MGISVNVCAPMGSSPDDLTRLGAAHFNVLMYPETGESACRWMERELGLPFTKTVPIGVGATRDFLSEISALTGIPAKMGEARLRLPWYSASVDSTYLTGKRVFIFGDGTHVAAAARIARDEMGFEVAGLGCYNREMARPIRALAKEYGVEALITDDYLDVEQTIEALAPEMILGTQMERHIGKRLGIPCAVISAPVHVQDYPARYSPQMGIEGANVIFDTWVHPLVMGLEEHLLNMFREDFEFYDDAGASHHGGTHVPPRRGRAANRSGPGPGRCATRSGDLAGRCGTRAEEDPVLRARQGTREHRSSPPNAAWPRSGWTRFTRQRRIMLDNLTISPRYSVAIITLDAHSAGPCAKAATRMAEEFPGLEVTVHAAAEWGESTDALEAARAAVARADIIVSTLLFLEEHLNAIVPDMKARRDDCDAMVGMVADAQIVKLTRMGTLDMGAPASATSKLLQKLRGSSKPSSQDGARKMRMLKRMPRMLKLIPGKAQDLRAWFLMMQYWLGGSNDNIEAMIRFLISRYCHIEEWRGGHVPAPQEYPETGLYHPRSGGPDHRRSRRSARTGWGARHGRRALDAQLCAVGRHRTLRRRDPGARGARAAGFRRLFVGAGRASRHRDLLPRHPWCKDRRAAVADRVQPCRRASL